jgi:hypothetical protein
LSGPALASEETLVNVQCRGDRVAVELLRHSADFCLPEY